MQLASHRRIGPPYEIRGWLEHIPLLRVWLSNKALSILGSDKLQCSRCELRSADSPDLRLEFREDGAPARSFQNRRPQWRLAPSELLLPKFECGPDRRVAPWHAQDFYPRLKASHLRR